MTETEDIAEALAAAARRWPEDKDRPSRLLRRLIDVGRRTIEPRLDERRAERLQTIRRLSGAYTGLYEPGHLENLRSEWPE